MVRENGVKTYFASDIGLCLQQARTRLQSPALHLGRRSSRLHRPSACGAGRPRRAPAESFEVRLVQFVSLFRGGEKAQMSTRSGEFVTLRDLRKEVGQRCGAAVLCPCAATISIWTSTWSSRTARTNDNPVYYIQYAHARVASVMRQLQERGLAHDAAQGLESLDKLTEPQELQLIKRVSAFPEIVRQCAAQRAPHTLVHYLRDLANDFHTNYSAHQFLVDDAGLPQRPARSGAGSADRHTQRPGTLGRIRARDDVGDGQGRGARLQDPARQGIGLLRMDGRSVRIGSGPRRGRLRVHQGSPARRGHHQNRQSGQEEIPRRRGSRRRSRGFGHRTGQILCFLRHAAEVRSGGSREGQRRSARTQNPFHETRRGTYVLQAGSYKNFADAIACVRNSPCKASNPRCRRCRWTTIPGTASASARFPSWTNSIACARSCAKPTSTYWSSASAIRHWQYNHARRS